MAKTRLTLSRAADGCILYKSATGCSEHTITDYRYAYRKLLTHFDPQTPIADITRDQLIQFLAWLQHKHIAHPAGGVAPRPPRKLAPKSVYNIHVACSALWQWALDEGYVQTNHLRDIDPPKFEPPAIEPFTKDQIQALLKSAAWSRAWHNRPSVRNRRPTADRDQAILLLLLDTGIRRSELCRLTVADLDLSTNAIHIRGKGRGRDHKERICYFGKSTARHLWRYLTPRVQNDTARDADPLFVVGPDDAPRPLRPNHLRLTLKRIGDRAGISDVHPHRFRHTFAITYLRNNGDPWTLQRLLGHSTLEMVKRYLRLVQSDCADAHRRASPVDNWRL